MFGQLHSIESKINKLSPQKTFMFADTFEPDQMEEHKKRFEKFKEECGAGDNDLVIDFQVVFVEKPEAMH